MIFRTALKRIVLIALAALGGIGMQGAQAGDIVASVWADSDLLSFPNTILGAIGGPLSLTITSVGEMGAVNAITSVQIGGANAGDFALVGGGTCAVNSPLPAGSTCTQNVQFNPSAAGTRTGTFLVSCVPVGAIGGFTVVCDSNVGTLSNLQGIGALIQNIPALGAQNLTLLAVLLIMLAGYFGLRRGKN